MKKFIAPVAATAAALALVAPIAPANAAQLTQFKDENGNALCRINLNDQEKGPANQASRLASTLTKGVFATSAVEAFEFTFEGLEELGSEYVANASVREYLRAIRDGETKPSSVERDKARAAIKPRLALAGLKGSDADMYLDLKETAQIPASPAGEGLVQNADVYININGQAPKAQKFGTGYEVGNPGKNLSNQLQSVPAWKKDAFASNLNGTYYGQVMKYLEKSYYYSLIEAQNCYDGVTHVQFNGVKWDREPAAPVLKNADLGEPFSPAPKPDPKPATEKPAPENPVPEKPAPRPNPNEGKSSFDAELSKVIGIIAAVLAALGALFGILNALGVKGLPTIPQIPGQWG